MVERLTKELREAREQQTATAELLRIISSSPTDAQPVFDTIVRNFVSLCGSIFGTIFTFDGQFVHFAGAYGFSSEQLNAFRTKYPVHVNDSSVISARAILTRAPVHIHDIMSDPYYDREHAAAAGEWRRMLGVPMLREGVPLGAIVAAWSEAGAIPKQHEDLLKVFAAQAVIAIENVRLFDEVHKRTADLTESLEQQSATADVLRVISSSPGELEPVFQAMLENATRICEAKFGDIFRFDGNAFNFAARVNTPPELAEFQKRRGPFQPIAGGGMDRMMRTKQAIQVADNAGEAVPTPAARLGGARSTVWVPMLKDDALVGSITIYRQEVRPFTDKQIELLTNFAAQAVIAIENTRLLNELRESLQQQTATADVLKVISSSPGGLEPVFNVMLENATRICEAKFGTLWLTEGDSFRAVALHNAPRGYGDARRAPVRPSPKIALGRMAMTKQVVQVADLAAEDGYLERDPIAVASVELAGVRTLLCVPMLRDNELVGAINIYRQEVRPFTDKQIELVQNFAAQAVIAIENTRLLNELREALEQQTATSEVLSVISSSPGELEPVFQTMLEKAVRICDAKFGVLFRVDNETFNPVAHFGVTPEHAEFMRQRSSFRPTSDSGLDRVLRTKELIRTADVATESASAMGAPARFGGARSLIIVPMLNEDVLIGAITIYRQEVKPFTEKQIELVQNFAAQAVIAVENTRLLNELRQRTAELEDKGHQLEVASQHKSQFLANMSHELRTPLNAILGYTELMADGVYGQLPEKTMGVLKRLESNGRHLLGLINDVLDLSKIEAGQLVLELSDYSLQDIASTVRSTLEPLAADKKLAFKVEMAPKMPPGHGDGRRLTQVLINLVGNAIKFTDAGEVVITVGATDG